MSHVLLVLCCLVAPWFYGFVELAGQPVAFTDLLLPACLVAWLLQRQQALSGLGLALLCFGVAALLSVVSPIGEGGPLTALLKVVRLWGIIAPAILLSGDACTRERWVRYLKAFFVGGLVSLLLGLAGFFEQWEGFVATQTYVYESGAYLHRAGGVFRDSGAYGHLLATWFACAVLLLMPEVAPRWRRVVLAIATVVGALGLYTSVSRSAALHMGTVIVLIVLLRPLHSGSRFPKFVAICTVFACAVAALLIDGESGSAVTSATGTLAQRMAESFSSLLGGVEDIERASGGRLTTWGLSLEAWAAGPVLGVGYKMLILNGNPPDNTFVLALCETGILGFVPLVFFFGMILWRAMDRYSRSDSEGRTFLILWLGQFVHGLNADILTFFGSVAPLLVFTLIWYRLTGTHFEAPEPNALAQSGTPLVDANLTHHGAR